jgi:hypothetical protein
MVSVSYASVILTRTVRRTQRALRRRASDDAMDSILLRFLQMATSEKRRRSQNAWKRKRYAEDEEFRENIKAANRAYNRRKRPEINARNKNKYATDPDYRERVLAGNRKGARKVTLKMKYGMSLEDYDERLAQQQGVCLICKRAFAYRLCVDHCHETREVRSLLCIKCNLGLGHYEHNPVFLRNAANLMDDWLRRHPELRKRMESMTPAAALSDDGKAGLMVRRAILHELRQPPGLDQPPPADRLQQIVRSFLDRAGQGDMIAIKEVLDRVDGKAPLACSRTTQAEAMTVVTPRAADMVDASRHLSQLHPSCPSAGSIG